MQIVDLTNPSLVHLDVPWATKDEVIDRLIDALARDGAVTDAAAFRAAVHEREAHGPTGMQDGLAIPHGKSTAVAAGAVAAARLSTPIQDWESVMPDNPVDLVFLLAIPETEAGTTHLQVLSQLATRFMDADARESFMSARNEEEFIEALNRPEALVGAGAAAASTVGAVSGRGGEAPRTTAGGFPLDPDKRPLILAITACAAGIAHTYMAAAALEKAGRELGIDVFVEKQGANGIEDRHSLEQISEADAVIFAVDTVAKNKERYAGKPFVQTKVAEPLRRAPEMLMQALERPDGIVSGVASDTRYEGEDEEQSLAGEIAAAVLTGISYMIPVIVAGGLMMGIAKLTWQYGLGLDVSEMGSQTPEEWGGFEGLIVNLDMFGALIFSFMYPIFALFMASAIADRGGIVGGFTAGLLAGGIHFRLWGQDEIASGFMGALVLGLGVGYFARWLNLKIKVPQAMAAIKPMLLIPGLSVLSLFLVNLYLVEPFFGWLNQIIYDAILSMPVSATLALSAVIAAATAFDLGGPVNKAAGAVAIGLAADGVFPLTPRVLAIVIPPLGIGLAVILDKYLFRRELYDEEEQVVGQTSFLLGFLAISEGAIPFMLRHPLYVIPINMIGAIVGACTAVWLGAVQWLPLPAIWGWPLVEENLWAYLLGMLIGVLTITALYTAARIHIKRKRDEHIAMRHRQHIAEKAAAKTAAVG